MFSQTLENLPWCLILLLLIQIPMSSLTTTYVPFVTWQHFMHVDAQTSPSW